MSVRASEKKECRCFLNGSIGVQILNKDLKTIRKQPPEHQIGAAWEKVKDILDFYADAVETEESESSPDKTKKMLFSYQTLMEYTVTVDDMRRLIGGRYVKLWGDEPKEKTLNSMMWQPETGA